MKIEEALVAIESCDAVLELRDLLQILIEDFGFASFNFLDVGRPDLDEPYYFGTTGDAWEQDYKNNGFIHVDHCVHFARKTNVPFAWDEVAPPHPETGPKPGAIRLMNAARDYGFANGLVLPFHVRDPAGRMHSSLCVLYWKSSLKSFQYLISRNKHKLHIILIYWVQAAIRLIADQERSQKGIFATESDGGAGIKLTDRERDVLSWAARGKTAADTAEILKIGSETVGTHLRHAMSKLNANNKTHATVKAIYLGLIDP